MSFRTNARNLKILIVCILFRWENEAVERNPVSLKEVGFCLF